MGLFNIVICTTKLLMAIKTGREYRARLKERFRNGGFDGFLSHEVLDLILTYALTSQDTKPVARSLLKKFGGLRGVFDASTEELTGVNGVGERAAILIKLFKEAAGEYLKDRMMGKDVLKNPQDVLDYLNLTLSGERVEKFFAIYLNPRNEILAIEILHEGTINQTVVYPRKAIEKAFQHNAQSVIFVHNHPSGDATPSNTDRQLAAVLNRAAHSVDLIVHDHLVIGRNNHFSARENGWMAPTKGRFITALP